MRTTKTSAAALAIMFLVGLAGVSGCGDASSDSSGKKLTVVAVGKVPDPPRLKPDPTPTADEAEAALRGIGGKASRHNRVVCARPISAAPYPYWDCLVTYQPNDVEECGIQKPTANGHLPDAVSCLPLANPNRWYARCVDQRNTDTCQRFGDDWVSRCRQRPAGKTACYKEIYGRVPPFAAKVAEPVGY